MINRLKSLSARTSAAASQMLAETDQAVADVALASGFYDHSAFTRVFRSATGETPTRFRARHR